MSARCDVTGARLTELALGQLSESARANLERHTASCARCTSRLARLSSGLSALAVAEPPPSTERAQRRLVLAAIAAAQTPRPRPRAFWTVALSFAAVALVVGVSLSRRPVTPPAPAPSTSAELIRLKDGSVLRPEPGARFERAASSEGELTLTGGEFALEIRPQAKGAPFRVVTPLAIVRVLGASFRVACDAHRTVVWTETGEVEVLRRDDGDLRVVTAGASISIEPLPHPDANSADAALERKADASSVEVNPAQPAREDMPPEVVDDAPPVEQFPRPRASDIRSRIRSGELGAARALLRRARAASSLARDDAELAIVDAELKLAEGRYEAAISAYISVSRRYAHTPQAETALFAAAGVALDHPGANTETGARLLQRYLGKYPHGRLREQADHLLRAVEEPRR